MQKLGLFAMDSDTIIVSSEKLGLKYDKSLKPLRLTIDLDLIVYVHYSIVGQNLRSRFNFSN